MAATAATVRTPDTLVDASEIARLYGVKHSTVLRWYRDGRIPGVRISRKTIRFDADQVSESIKRG